jgi:hypothetical protein
MNKKKKRKDPKGGKGCYFIACLEANVRLACPGNSLI